jgi:hypothetical protein
VSNVDWDINSEQPWLIINKTSGSNNAKIIITALPNNTNDSRTATVIVSSNGIPSQAIVLEQPASPKVLSVSTNILNITSPDSVNFDISSNVDWDINSDQPWLIINKTSGSNNAKIIITALPNNTNDSRTATVIVSGKNITSQSIMITQAGVNNTNVIKISGFDVQVYPSPVTDELIVSFSEIIPQTTILIYSLYGDKIFYSAINTKTIKVDLSNLPSGIYFIQYRVRGAVVQTKKIIKQ